MSNFQEQLGNYSEAANALYAYSESLPWDPSKENLCMKCISFYEKATLYEDAIDIYKALQNYYLNTLVDYNRLAFALSAEAKLVEKLIGSDRLKISHFRVAFYGSSFSSALRGEHIFRGNALQQPNEFAEQLKKKFPSAEFLNYTSPPPDEVVNSEEKQYIQLFQVRPSTSEEINGKPRPAEYYKKPEKIRFFDDNFHLQVFTYRQPFKKTKTDNEFRDLWTRLYFYQTEDVLPSIIRRSRITKVVVREISPIENAVDSMISKNREMEDMILKYAVSKPPSDVNPFTQAIQGVVQAFVNGGTKQYENLFFPPEYLQEYPEHESFVLRLKQLLEEQDLILERALKLFAKVCPKEFEPLRLSFEDTFSLMKQEKQEKQEKNQK